MDRPWRIGTLLILIWRSAVVASAAGVSHEHKQTRCIGVLLEYQVATATEIYPFLPANSSKMQPYKFESTLSLLNTGSQKVRNWQVFIGFQHNEWLAGAEGAVLANGVQFPAQVGNEGATLIGFPDTDIENAIATAGDESKIQVSVNLVGTEFGISEFPLPKNLSLANGGWDCELPHKLSASHMRVCCSEKTMKSDQAENGRAQAKYLPHETGDVTILYDVLQTYENLYRAQVTISNNIKFGRLDNWILSWNWNQGEFISSIRGAQTTEQDQSSCINGPAGSFYKDLDFFQVMNCQRTPNIIDLDVDKINNKKLGQLPFCCKNGTLLPSFMDPSRSKSVFQMEVHKLPPNNARDKLVPPTGFNIGNKFQCGIPRQVSPSRFPDPETNMHYKSAVVSWEVTCNSSRTVSSSRTPTCCVSYSAFYSESAVPCRTCACGCPASLSSCNSSAEALLLPAEALLVPFENRGNIIAQWREYNGYRSELRGPAPCGDYCGVNINWHVLSDHGKRWSARMSILNWRDAPVADWFSVVELDGTKVGFRRSYTFNTSVIRESDRLDLFVQGKPGLNYLLGKQKGDQHSEQLQSVFLFTKNIRFKAEEGDEFPTRVMFNGKECALPNTLPLSSAAGRSVSLLVLLGMIGLVVFSV